MYTRKLVQSIVRTSAEELPEYAMKEAKRSFINWLGVALAGSTHSAVSRALDTVHMLGKSEQATILGRQAKVDLWSAALINGIASHVLDFDDTLLDVVLHPSAPVFPAIFALAEHRGLSGRELLSSFVIGCETEVRVAECLHPSHYERGWHVTGTAGAIGSVVAVGKLLQLNEEQMIYAIGLAACQPTGLRGMFGTMTKSFHPGMAAANGLFSALLGQNGFTSSTESLEGKRGYGAVLSDAPCYDALIEAWGDNWKIAENSYKPFACGLVVHPAIDAMVRARRHNLDVGAIEEVVVTAHPLVLELTGKVKPTNGLEAKFSVYHAAAVGFLMGKAGESEFQTEKALDPEVISLREKISVVSDSLLGAEQARIRIVLQDGRIVEEFVEAALGSTKCPLSDEVLEQKFLDATLGILEPRNQGSLLDLVNGIEDVKNVSLVSAKCH